MDAQFRFIVGLLAVVNAVLLVFLCGLIVEMRKDVEDLRGVLATKEDLVTVAVPGRSLFQEEKCTSCHTERRFAGEHNVRGSIENALAQMQAMPDAHFTEEEMAKVHASLTLLRCASCHGEDQLRMLALKDAKERMSVIRRMVAKPGSNMTPDEVSGIQRAYQRLYGF